MKPWLYIFAMLAITTIASCKKADIIEKVGIVGKWQLIEVFNGYANGGDFTWSPVSIDNAHTITFTLMENIIRKKILTVTIRNVSVHIAFKFQII
jgi:hypothetical protein